MPKSMDKKHVKLIKKLLLYTVPTKCHVCGKDFMARYNTADRARVCTSPAHVCKKGDKKLKGDRKIPCIEKCCRSKYARSSAASSMDSAIDPRKVLSKVEFDGTVKDSRKVANPIGLTIRFIASTGCRLGEALLVRVQDILFQPGKLSIAKIPTLKRGGRPVRTVYLSNSHWIVPELKTFVKSMKPADPLFRVARRSVQKAVEDILDKRKPDREGLVHIFRHTRASQMIEAGADWQMVRQALGWSSLEMAKRYVHTNEDQVSKVLGKI